MTTYYARTDYEYQGGDRLFTIPFSYIDESHILVKVNDEVTHNFVFNTTSQIQIDDELIVGDIVTIIRETPVDERLVNFTDTSILNAENQNLSATQTFNVVQEIFDRNTTFEIRVEGNIDEIQQKVEEANETAQTALDNSNEALDQSTTALLNSQQALTTANAASQTATQASSDASEAVETANNAETIAERAEDKVDEFGEDIEIVKEAAEKIGQFEEAIQLCIQKANEASASATSANNAATTATTAAQTATAKAEEAKAKVGDLADLTTTAKTTVVAAINEVNAKDSLPSQTGQSGKFLTTDGTNASWGVASSFNVFDFKWTDCLQNDMSWLRADTFSWQDGTVYNTAYEHLVDDIDGITPITESGISVYVANDGHKIVLAEDEQTVLDLYNNTGVAWYYILDQDNTRFKLPRSVRHGDIIETGENNGISYRIYQDGYCEQWGQTTQVTGSNTATVSYLKTYNNDDILPYIQPLGAYTGQGEANNVVISHSASGFTLQSGHIAPQYFGWKACGYLAQNQYLPTNTPNRYLYFYVGEFSQTAIEQTAGITAEQLNAKVDLDASNFSSTGKEIIVSWMLPDLSRGEVKTAPNVTYTASSDGWLWAGGGASINTNGNAGIYINGEYRVICTWDNTVNTVVVFQWIPIRKGDTYSGAYGCTTLYFYPMKGV